MTIEHPIHNFFTQARNYKNITVALYCKVLLDIV